MRIIFLSNQLHITPSEKLHTSKIFESNHSGKILAEDQACHVIYQLKTSSNNMMMANHSESTILNLAL